MLAFVLLVSLNCVCVWVIRQIETTIPLCNGIHSREFAVITKTSSAKLAVKSFCVQLHGFGCETV